MSQSISTAGDSLADDAEEALVHMIESMGTPNLARSTVEAVSSIVDIERMHVFEHAGPGEANRLHCSWAPRAELDVLNRAYTGRFYKVDPIYAALSNVDALRSSIVVRFDAMQIDDIDYRRSCFERFGIKERLSIAQKVKGRWLTLSVASRRQGFTDQEVKALGRFSRLALPLIAQHGSLFHGDKAGPFTPTELEERFALAYPDLTVREREVCARTVIGMTAEATAIDLGIGISTVLTYRRRAYLRLNITSAYQLSTLVLH